MGSEEKVSECSKKGMFGKTHEGRGGEETEEMRTTIASAREVQAMSPVGEENVCGLGVL